MTPANLKAAISRALNRIIARDKALRKARQLAGKKSAQAKKLRKE